MESALNLSISRQILLKLQYKQDFQKRARSERVKRWYASELDKLLCCLKLNIIKEAYGFAELFDVIDI